METPDNPTSQPWGVAGFFSKGSTPLLIDGDSYTQGKTATRWVTGWLTVDHRWSQLGSQAGRATLLTIPSETVSLR